MYSNVVILITVLFATNILLVASDDPITSNERAALKKFLPMVERYLTNENMKTDTYLIRWLRVKKLDLEEAKAFLLRSLEWRKENKIDDIKNELDTTSAIAKTFPTIITQDRQGRPVYITDWSADIRKVVLSGKGKEFTRYMGSIFELTEREIYKLNVHNNNSEFIAIYDMNKFTLTTHMCVQCLPILLEHSGRYERYYPLRAKKFYVINAPRTFQAVLRLIAPIIGNTAARITVFSADKKEWMPILLKDIAPEHLPAKYGGTL